MFSDALLPQYRARVLPDWLQDDMKNCHMELLKPCSTVCKDASSPGHSKYSCFEFAFQQGQALLHFVPLVIPKGGYAALTCRTGNSDKENVRNNRNMSVALELVVQRSMAKHGA